jgi:hypothetical protein
MDLSLLDTLKQRLIDAKEFSKVWTYFLDHFGEDPQFMALGERTRNDVVETLLVQTAKQVCGITIAANDILLTGLPEQKFIHGGCFVKGYMVNVLYFEEICTGTIMVCALGQENTVTLRFTGRPMADPHRPSMN